MTNEFCIAKAASTPHLSPEYFAYYLGRDAGEYGDKCEVTDPALVAAWKRGYRSIRAEIRLDNDAEWDG